MSVFYSTTLLLVLSFCCLFVPSSFSPHFVYTLSVFFNLSIVNLVLVTSELLGTTDPGCNRIGYVMFEKSVLICYPTQVLTSILCICSSLFCRKVQVIRFYLLLWR